MDFIFPLLETHLFTERFKTIGESAIDVNLKQAAASTVSSPERRFSAFEKGMS
jgi:hypothetical protein